MACMILVKEQANEPCVIICVDLSGDDTICVDDGVRLSSGYVARPGGLVRIGAR